MADDDRELIAQTLHFVADRVWRVTDSGFFFELVKYLGESLGVAYVFCDMIKPNDSTVVQTLALYAHGEIIENISYNLRGTPCENVIGRSTCCYVDRVQQLFPDDQLLVELKAESYAGIPLWSANGTPLGLIAIMDDKPLRKPDLIKTLLQIVAVRGGAELERSQFLAQLHVSERRFRDFAKSSSDWFWEMDKNLRFSYFSDRFMQVTGVPEESLLGSTREENGNPGASHEVWEKQLADLRDHKPFKDFIHPRTKPDGRVVWLSISGIPVYDENIFEGFRGTGTDITERVESERTIERLLHAIQHVPVGIALFDEDDRLIFFNTQYKTVMGVMGDILEIGETFENMLHTMVTRQPVKDAIGREADYIKERLAKHRMPGQPVEIHRVDRELLAYESRSSDGYTFNIITDITEHKKAENDLIIAKNEAEKANRAKSEFLASMSHELRTPLNAILGFSEIIKEQYLGPPGTGKYREYAGDIYKSGTHLLELVNDLLDISTIEAGFTSLEKEIVSIREIVNDCKHTIDEKAFAKNIQLTVVYPDDFTSIFADKRAVKQILLNLLSNAVKFTPKGGKITIHSDSADGKTRIRVTDNGRGIPTEELSSVTDPFTRSVMGPHIAEKGWGLGLAISKSLVELHDGEMIIESEFGKGTSVTVAFPSSLSGTD